MTNHLEYLGFKAQKSTREYALRVRLAGDDTRDFTLVIDNDAFLSNRVRYQDAPEICFLKLQRELDACSEGAQPARKLKVSNAELEEYRVAHSPKPRLHRLIRSTETTK
jgi:hypothetical protein